MSEVVPRDPMSLMNSALNAVKLLRLDVGNLFNTISEGVKQDYGEDGREFVNEVQRMINLVHQRYKDLEQYVNCIPNQVVSLNLQNTSFLTLESSADKHGLYSPLVRSHKWIEKVHKHSTWAHLLLTSNSPRKTLSLGNVMMARRKRPLFGHNLSTPPNWDSLISSLDRTLSDMNVSVYRSFATNVVLHVTLGKVLQAMIAFKGFMIEWVVIKGYTESCNTPDDLMKESRYNVFKRVTDHALAATLHYSSLNVPELVIKQYLFWLRSYLTLFSNQCKHCGKFLNDFYPPTWRDFKTYEAYHVECKP